MILVDTSAWIDFLNGHPSNEADALGRLLAGADDPATCGMVVTEVFQGLRRTRNRDDFERIFRRLTYLEPSTIDVYLRAAEIYRALRERGVTVRSAADCVIAAIAEEHECPILAKDRDFRAILESGLVRTVAWSLEPTRE